MDRHSEHRVAKCYSKGDPPTPRKRRVPRGGRKNGPDLTQSPLLVEGKLIFLGSARRSADTLMAFDSMTGKELWCTSVAPDRGNEATGAAVPRVLRLNGTAIVVTKMGDAVAVADGRPLGSNLFEQEDFRPVGYDMSTPVNAGGQALLRLRRDGDDHWYTAGIQLRFAGRTGSKMISDAVWEPRRIEAVQGNGPKFGYQIQHLLYHGDRWYLQGWPDLVTIDARNGATLAWQKAPTEMRGHTVWHEYPTTHLAGRYLFTGDRNGYAAVYEVDSAWKRVGLSRVDPNWHSNPFFHGDRIYIRTHDALYCIGPKPVPEQ